VPELDQGLLLNLYFVSGIEREVCCLRFMVCMGLSFKPVVN